MLDYTQLSLFAAAVALLAITPGPDIVYVLTRGMTQGRKAALYAALGFSSGVVFHTLIAAVGLAALLRASALAFMMVKYAGALYLIYIGIKTLRAKDDFTGENGAPKRIRAIYWQSVLANVLNPKVALFFLAFLPQFVVVERGNTELQMALLGGIFMVISFLVFGCVGLFAGAIGERLRRNAKLSDYLRWGAGSVLIGLGLRLAWPEGNAAE